MNTSLFRPATGTKDTGEFELVAKIARENWGLKLDQSKESSILPRLEKRKQALGIDRLSDYCERVSQSPDEAQYFVNALTTNVTHFYREAHHFQDLEQNVLIPRSSHVSGGGRLRIWSAGCSSGQEAYSIAGSIFSTISGASSKDIKILATDIDTSVLRTAALAKYHPSECSFPKGNLENRIFHPNDDGKIVREELRKMVSFRHLNLVKPWPFRGLFDAVFCRNVAIYFERETQERLWSAFAKVMCEGATLYIGHSERINDPEKFDLRADGITTYRKYK